MKVRAQLSVTASGTGPLSYAWYFNGARQSAGNEQSIQTADEYFRCWKIFGGCSQQHFFWLPIHRQLGCAGDGSIFIPA